MDIFTFVSINQRFERPDLVGLRNRVWTTCILPEKNIHIGEKLEGFDEEDQALKVSLVALNSTHVRVLCGS